VTMIPGIFSFILTIFYPGATNPLSVLND